MAESIITMDTDWGASGAQLSGCQVQAFIKNSLKELQTENSTLAQTVSQYTSEIHSASGHCLIAYHQNLDGRLRAVPYWLWPELEEKGEVADGVVIFPEGRRPMVIGISDTTLLWSTQQYATATSNKSMSEAYADFDGFANTSLIIESEQKYFEPFEGGQLISVSRNATTYCNQYSSLHDKGNGTMIGIGQGKWWLPSIGELLLICKHIYEINQCMTHIKHAIPLFRSIYHSSSEKSFTEAWCVNLATGMIYEGSKTREQYHVRPICWLED